jgi:hypothetical protein
MSGSPRGPLALSYLAPGSTFGYSRPLGVGKAYPKWRYLSFVAKTLFFRRHKSPKNAPHSVVVVDVLVQVDPELGPVRVLVRVVPEPRPIHRNVRPVVRRERNAWDGKRFVSETG